MLRWLIPLLTLLLFACASAPPPPSRSPHDPSNPNAEETPSLRAQDPANPPSPPPASAVGVYACPMHADVTATEPGHRCPKCGMELVPQRKAP